MIWMCARVCVCFCVFREAGSQPTEAHGHVPLFTFSTLFLARLMLLYLTALDEGSLLSAHVDICWESCILAQPLLHLSCLSTLFWASNLQVGKRKKAANMALLSGFQELCCQGHCSPWAPWGAEDASVPRGGWLQRQQTMSQCSHHFGGSS